MGSVYGRVVILHVTILGSAFLIGLLGTPLAALVLLIVLKTILDVALHLREHQRRLIRGAFVGRATTVKEEAERALNLLARFRRSKRRGSRVLCVIVSCCAGKRAPGNRKLSGR
jgi:hypothetical protein